MHCSIFSIPTSRERLKHFLRLKSLGFFSFHFRIVLAALPLLGLSGIPDGAGNEPLGGLDVDPLPLVLVLDRLDLHHR